MLCKNNLSVILLFMVSILALVQCNSGNSYRYNISNATQASLNSTPANASGCVDPWGCVVVAAGDPLHIGLAFSMSGPNKTSGLNNQRGVEIAAAERGTVAGHPFKLITEDGMCSAEGGQTAALKLSSHDSIVAVIGHNCSSSAGCPNLQQCQVNNYLPLLYSPRLNRRNNPCAGLFAHGS